MSFLGRYVGVGVSLIIVHLPFWGVPLSDRPWLGDNFLLHLNENRDGRRALFDCEGFLDHHLHPGRWWWRRSRPHHRWHRPPHHNWRLDRLGYHSWWWDRSWWRRWRWDRHPDILLENYRCLWVNWHGLRPWKDWQSVDGHLHKHIHFIWQIDLRQLEEVYSRQ